MRCFDYIWTSLEQWHFLLSLRSMCGTTLQMYLPSSDNADPIARLQEFLLHHLLTTQPGANYFILPSLGLLVC